MAEMTIRRFGVLSVAKIYGTLLFIFGLIFGVIYGLFFIIFGAAISALGNRDATAGGVSSVVIGIAMMIGIPVAYGVMGFIMGAISALVYNALAGTIGGVKMELEGALFEYAPPPAPQNWEPQRYPAQ